VSLATARTVYQHGLQMLQAGRLEEALGDFDRLMQLLPDNVDVLNNRAALLLELQRPQEALASLDRALQLRPGFPLALTNRGNALRTLHRPQEALACYEAALAGAPASPELLANTANALADLQLHERAVSFYERSLRQLRDPEILCSRGDSLLRLGRPAEALASYEQCLRSHPSHCNALFGAGLSLIALERLPEGASCLQRLRAVAPDHPYAHGYELFARWRVCDWTDAERRRREVDAAVRGGAAADVPFSFLTVSDSAAAQLQCARTFVTDRYPGIDTRPCTPRHHDRIRLAYVSGDLRNHIVSRLLVGVFERHNRQRFEVSAIALRPAEYDAFGGRVRAAFDRFVDVSARTDADVSEMMRQMEIDIAIDLTGFTEGQRTQIFARRAAPVQVNYLGYPGTMGASFIDYILADEFVIPAASRQHYAEEVIHLPGCFHPTDDRRCVPEKISRARSGLPEDALVCCSLNNSYKYSARLLDIWIRMVQQARDGVLWLLAPDATTEANLRDYVTARGLSKERLFFARRMPYEEHLARLTCADLFLDTVPFNGGATVSDVLWAGVPVLTCAGEAFAARMAGSLLHAVGLPELVTSSLEEYERLGLEVVTDTARLHTLRQRLENQRSDSPLFDTTRYCRNLEAAYQGMYERVLPGGQ
jgi:protein O-GlcNAc transferase